MLKPDVVFFGENVPRDRVDAAPSDISMQADAMLIVGSSLMVYSGFRFVQCGGRALGKPAAAVNLGRTRADGLVGVEGRADLRGGAGFSVVTVGRVCPRIYGRARVRDPAHGDRNAGERA